MKLRLHSYVAFTLLCLTSICHAQKFTVLQYFNGTNGATPVETPLVQGTDGNLYGTTLGGGVNSSGTVFKLTPSGKLTTVYSFCSKANCTDGSGPYGGLALGRDGNLYGTTSTGGANGTSGTVFKISLKGVLQTLHSFSGTDGASPITPMILGSDGNLYGMTENGGTSNSGTVFKITPSGQFTSLHSFEGTDGTYSTGPLVQASDGNFYGSTQLGGSYGYGSLFKVTPSGTFSTFYSFDSLDGSSPASGLTLASDGNLYGTTYEGGSSSTCPNGCGTVFKITLQGALTTIHNFQLDEPSQPIGALIQATDGNFYGTSYAGGTAANWGTIYEITPSGVVTTLHSFTGADGAQPYAPVAQSTNGTFYGTATNGTGTAGEGTVFSQTNNLQPFVAFVQTSGKAGQIIGILGQGFKGTTSVMFGSVSASFSVVSGTYLRATVPAGASTGFVTVKTPGGNLTSNVEFSIH